MQALTNNSHIVENRDTYMLQYILQQPNMLSTTEYKVLQGQQAAGLIPCYRVIYNAADKLDYDIEAYDSLQALLPSLAHDTFYNYVKSAIAIILNIKHIGFLHPYNLATTLDKVFVDTQTHSVYMVYLPIRSEFCQQPQGNYATAFKAGLASAIQNSSHLQSGLSQAILLLLQQDTTTLEHLLEALANVPPLQAPAVTAPVGTAALNPTSAISATSAALTSGGLASTGLGQPAEQPAPHAAATPIAEGNPAESKKNKKRGLFGAKKQKQQREQEPQYAGGTEVLSMFVPSIYLKGTGKAEILISKQEFVLGRDNTADGPIDSTAISRRHCKITHADNRNYVTDLGSANGTYLNGTQLAADKPHPLNEGDKLKLGNISFTVMSV